MSGERPIRVEVLNHSTMIWEDFGLRFEEGRGDEGVEEVLTYSLGCAYVRAVDERTGAIVAGPRGTLVIESPEPVYEKIER